MIFRRKAKNDDTEATGPAAGDEAVETEETDASGERAKGPYDSAVVDPELLEAEDRIDLGALVITGMPGMELRLQVDEQSNEVQAVLLVLEDSALELRAFAAPKTAGIWADVLGVPQVSRHTSFFDLGGQSLQLLQVHSRLRERFGPKLTVVDMFKHPTVSSLAQRLTATQDQFHAADAGRDRAATRRALLDLQRGRRT